MAGRESVKAQLCWNTAHASLVGDVGREAVRTQKPAKVRLVVKRKLELF